ncbi:MAG: hypothetical protein V4731_16585 [Pseudomonadota bacterium]
MSSFLMYALAYFALLSLVLLFCHGAAKASRDDSGPGFRKQVDSIEPGAAPQMSSLDEVPSRVDSPVKGRVLVAMDKEIN